MMQDNNNAFAGFASAAAAAAADGGGGGSSSSSMMMQQLPPQFLQNPFVYLSEVASMRPMDPKAFTALAGPVAKWFSNTTTEHSSSELGQIATIYLQAASTHLKETEVKVGDVNEEMTRTKQKYEIMEAVGVAASKAPRMGISSSEILPTLAHIMLSNKPNELQQAGVEFLQCALMAGQYRYASRVLRGTWPRPNSTVSVKMVLRYYYLRGMIYIGCDDFILAHRCFWTCLTIPAEINSKIMIEAWKKLVLVQCLLGDSMTSKGTNLPKNVPNVLSRLLSSYKEASKMPPSSKQDAAEKAGLSCGGDDPNQQQQQLDQQQQAESKSMISTMCYIDIASAFYKRDRAEMESLMQKHEESVLRADNNTGLVVQVHTRLIRNQIYHLSQIYSAIPISKLSESLNIPETEIPSALRQSQIVCEIQQHDSMVVFGDQQTTNSTSSVDISEWMHLLDTVQKLDVSISTNAKYHSLVRKDGMESSSTSGAATSLDRAQQQQVGGPRGVEDF